MEHRFKEFLGRTDDGEHVKPMNVFSAVDLLARAAELMAAQNEPECAVACMQARNRIADLLNDLSAMELALEMMRTKHERG